MYISLRYTSIARRQSRATYTRDAQPLSLSLFDTHYIDNNILASHIFSLSRTHDDGTIDPQIDIYSFLHYTSHFLFINFLLKKNIII